MRRDSDTAGRARRHASGDAPASPRRAALGLAAALAWLAVSTLGGTLAPPPDLRPVMPEVDGVHPVRALAALRDAYAPGRGFLDKYPPLGSFLMGLAARAADPGLADAAGDVAALPPAGRAAALWPLRDRIARALAAQRGLSVAATALAVAFLALLAWDCQARLGVPAALGWPIALLVAPLGFGQTYLAQFYATTTNVDAAALAASLAAFVYALRGRAMGAGLALGLAVALKDPAFALGPAVVLAAGMRGGARRALVALAWSLGAYAVAGGALLTPGTWSAHVAYLVSGGVDPVPGIDHGRLAEWLALLGYAVRLLVESAGLGACVLGAAGWVLAARDRATAVLVAGAFAGTLGLFVLPAGFVYPRFLFAPMALLWAGGAVAVGAGAHALARRMRVPLPARMARGGAAVAALLLGWLVVDALAARWDLPAGAGVARAELVALRSAPDPRAQVAAALPAGSSVTLFTAQAEHGPPLDPHALRLEVRGLADAGPSLARWRETRAARSDYLVVMTFPTDPPSGDPPPPHAPPRVGAAVEGLYVVVDVFGAPTGGIVERSLAIRPVITLMRRRQA